MSGYTIGTGAVSMVRHRRERAVAPPRLVLVRQDWPPGSNARLLARQVRGPFGFSWAQASPNGPRHGKLPPSHRLAEIAPPPVFLVPLHEATPRGTHGLRPNVAALWAFLLDLQGDTLPSMADLSERLNWGRLGDGMTRLAAAFERLVAAGLIRQSVGQNAMRGQRVVLMVASRRVLRTARWPDGLLP